MSFGDAVRTEASRRGLGDSRATLQDLGDELVAAGWDAFCALVIGQVEWDGRSSLVVDGVRHLAAVDALRRTAAPASFFLAFIDTPWERRAKWLAERGVSGSSAAAADHHRNESELEDVIGQANLVVANNADLDRVVGAVVTSLDRAGGLE